jgi:rubrerythrin
MALSAISAESIKIIFSYFFSGGLMGKTKENLLKAFAGESQARNKYDFFASVARKEGFEQIAAIFEEAALNEKEHAKRVFKLLNELGDTKKNLKAAAAGENHEWTKMYPKFEKAAREEGQKEAADFFKEVAEVEEQHEKRYKKLLENIEKGIVFKRDSVVEWKCRNCGYIHKGKEAPEVCPACLHPRSFYELRCQNY